VHNLAKNRELSKRKHKRYKKRYGSNDRRGQIPYKKSSLVQEAVVEMLLPIKRCSEQFKL
jgi:hypothetical protein